MLYNRLIKRHTVETPFIAKFHSQKSNSEPEFLKPGSIQSIPRIVLKLLESTTSINLSWKWILKISKFESAIHKPIKLLRTLFSFHIPNIIYLSVHLTNIYWSLLYAGTDLGARVTAVNKTDEIYIRIHKYRLIIKIQIQKYME